MEAAVHSEKVRRMREEFDAAFAAPVLPERPDSEDMLAIRLGVDGYALRVAELAGVSAARRLLPLPGAPRGLLGLCGARGALAPVWDLATLLGYPPSARELRWLAMGPGDSPWALAFEELDGYFRVARSELTRAAEAGAPSASGFADAACAMGGMTRKVVALGRVLDAVKALSQSLRTRKDGT